MYAETQILRSKWTSISFIELLSRNSPNYFLRIFINTYIRGEFIMKTVDNFLKRYCKENIVVKEKSVREQFCDESNKTLRAQQDFKSRINKTK